MRSQDRLYRFLLRLYPNEFRSEYGREMVQIFRDRARYESFCRIWSDIIRDLLVTVPKERTAVLVNDLHYALRVVRRSPAFSLAAIVTVALTIAANTAMFSIVNAVLVRPLPFAESERLIQVAEKDDRFEFSNVSASVLSFVSWRDQATTVDQFAAIGFETFNLAGVGEPQQCVGNRISPSLLNVLGLRPVAGRGFTEAEEKQGAAPVAMISERLWVRRFSRNPSMIGRTVTLNSAPVMIVGIAPAALSVFSNGDVFVPLVIDPADGNRLNHVIDVAARLKPGVTLQQAQAEFDNIVAGMHRTYPELRDWGIHLLTFFEAFVSPQVETTLLVLLAAFGFVLLIACAIIANRLLARAMARDKESVASGTLGPSRSPLLRRRQLLIESVTLSAIGGSAGIAVAVCAVRAINASLPATLLPVPEVHINGTVLLFAVGLTMVARFIFVLAPASYAARVGLHDATGRGGTTDRAC